MQERPTSVGRFLFSDHLTEGRGVSTPAQPSAAICSAQKKNQCRSSHGESQLIGSSFLVLNVDEEIIDIALQKCAELDDRARRKRLLHHSTSHALARDD